MIRVRASGPGERIARSKAGNRFGFRIRPRPAIGPRRQATPGEEETKEVGVVLRGRFFHRFILPEPFRDFQRPLPRPRPPGEAARWRQFETWMRACRRGRVGEVLAELRRLAGALGPCAAGGRRTGPATGGDGRAARFVEQPGRMNYPRYRRAGLPVTSSWVESLVGEFNGRVKGRDKYGNRSAGAEAILQVCAAVLSEDGRLTRYFAQRPGNPYRRRQAVP